MWRVLVQICSSLSLYTSYSIISLIMFPDAREGISYHLTAKRSHPLRLTLTPALPAAAWFLGMHEGEGITPESLDYNEALLLFHPNRAAFLLLEAPPNGTWCPGHFWSLHPHLNRAHDIRDTLYWYTFCFSQTFLAKGICPSPFII